MQIYGTWSQDDSRPSIQLTCRPERAFMSRGRTETRSSLVAMRDVGRFGFTGARMESFVRGRNAMRSLVKAPGARQDRPQSEGRDAKVRRDLHTLIADWLTDLELRGRSPGTIRTYRSVVRTMLAEARSPDELTPDRVRLILRDCLSFWASASVGTGTKVLHSFCIWLVQNNELNANPLSGLPRPTTPIKQHRFLSPEDVRCAWRATRNEDEQLLVVLLLNGLRAMELCSLTWGDVDPSADVLHIRSAKGCLPRAIPLQPRLLDLLTACKTHAAQRIQHQRESMSIRGKDDKTPKATRPTPGRTAIMKVLSDAASPLTRREINNALADIGYGPRAHISSVLHHMRMSGLVACSNHGFVLGDGNPLVPPVLEARGPLCAEDRIFPFMPETLRRRVAELGRRAGIVHLHPHLFRHTFASHFRLEGGDEASLMAAGGWSSPNMARYYGRSALEAAAMKRSKALNLTERLLAAPGVVEPEHELVTLVLSDPKMRAQLLLRLLESASVVGT